jgi:hypothetical protein
MISAWSALVEKLEERTHWEDLDVNRIIIK